MNRKEAPVHHSLLSPLHACANRIDHACSIRLFACFSRVLTCLPTLPHCDISDPILLCRWPCMETQHVQPLLRRHSGSAACHLWIWQALSGPTGLAMLVFASSRAVSRVARMRSTFMFHQCLKIPCSTIQCYGTLAVHQCFMLLEYRIQVYTSAHNLLQPRQTHTMTSE